MRHRRSDLIDALRGLALLNMLGMHFLYDVNVVFGRDPGWLARPGVFLWQQYICWSFILIAGFSFAWGGTRNLCRGLLLNVCGLVISAVTVLAVPEEAIWFGILNLLGCAILLTVPAEKCLSRLPPTAALLGCLALFFFFRHTDAGLLGFGSLLRLRLPAELYRFRALAPLGFPPPSFRSSDYFPLLPWYFLFLCGFFLRRLYDAKPFWQRAAQVSVPLLPALGRRTLWVYMLHQPLLMLICMLLFR